MATYTAYGTGAGPSLVPYSGPFQSGLAFTVTEGGCWFTGYKWWVPSGGDTAAQKFALWNITTGNPTGNALISGSVITSGTLTANAWNNITLSTPVQLAPGAGYLACTGWTAVNGFPDTQNQFASGEPFSAGITNGPLYVYSDTANGGSGTPIPMGMGAQGQFSANSGQTDPSVYMPTASSNSANFGIDVLVSDTDPTGYSGSYRIWPNFPGVGPQNSNQVDLNDPYILGTEFILSESCTLDNIWFYSPGAATQLPTQCAIWDVSSQTMVSGTLKTSPGWSGAAGSGWVSASYTGVTLASGDYKVSVWNASASGTGTGWNEYTVGYFTTGYGTSNIVNGPITVPNVTNATSPGQSTYANSSSTFLYPNTYVATEGQSYWVDVEVTPATASTFNGTLTSAVTAHAAFGGTKTGFGHLNPAATAHSTVNGRNTPLGHFNPAAAAHSTVSGRTALLGHLVTTAAASLAAAGKKTAKAVVSLAATAHALLTGHIPGAVRTPESLGGTVIEIMLGGSDSLSASPEGGTVSGPDYGGGATVLLTGFGSSETPDELGGSISQTDQGGSINLADLGGGAIGWTMQNVNLNFAEFNDITLSVAITSNGVALNLTGYTVNMLLKPSAGIVDTDGTVVTLSSAGGSPAITITSASNGQCSIAIPRTDVQNQNLTFYRIDAVDGSGNINTAIYGNITYTAL